MELICLLYQHWFFINYCADNLISVSHKETFTKREGGTHKELTNPNLILALSYFESSLACMNNKCFTLRTTKTFKALDKLCCFCCCPLRSFSSVKLKIHANCKQRQHIEILKNSANLRRELLRIALEDIDGLLYINQIAIAKPNEKDVGGGKKERGRGGYRLWFSCLTPALTSAPGGKRIPRFAAVRFILAEKGQRKALRVFRRIVYNCLHAYATLCVFVLAKNLVFWLRQNLTTISATSN